MNSHQKSGWCLAKRLGGALLLGLCLALLPGASLRGGEPVRLNRTIETVAGGKPVFGLFTGDFSLANARALARSKLDFIIIDMEHSALDFGTLQTFLMGMADKARIIEKGNLQPDVTPFVRIPMNGRESLQWQVKQVLDAGAFGVVFPYIESKAEAENAIRSMRYPQPRGDAAMDPAGLRGASPGIAIWSWGIADYVERADLWPLDRAGELLAVLQIESRQGVEQIDEILSVPGAGAIFIGPRDLSHSYGFPGQRDHPEVVAAMKKVLAACKKRSIPCGLTTNRGTVVAALSEGYDFVTIGYGDDAGISDEPARALESARGASGRNR